MKAFLEAERPQQGWTYDAYLARWREAASQQPTSDMDKMERKMLHYKKYNLDRTRAVHAEYEPSEALRSAVQQIDEPQLWMVLTEPWCGDSAYNLPIIAEAAALNDRIALRILPRDENLDIMDQYLTHGGRSIPKLVAFDGEGHEVFSWGPRPDELQAYRESLRDEGLDGMEVARRLIERYEDGAWHAVDAELTEAIRAGQAVAS